LDVGVVSTARCATSAVGVHNVLVAAGGAGRFGAAGTRAAVGIAAWFMFVSVLDRCLIGQEAKIASGVSYVLLLGEMRVARCTVVAARGLAVAVVVPSVWSSSAVRARLGVVPQCPEVRRAGCRVLAASGAHGGVRRMGGFEVRVGEGVKGDSVGGGRVRR
jgi:hypothetical protein